MTTEERIEATLASGVEPGQSAREYLAFAAAQRSSMGLEDVSGLGKALDEALAAVEKAAGKPLMMDDAAGMKAFYAKVESAVAGAGLDGDLATESMVTDAENEIKPPRTQGVDVGNGAAGHCRVGHNHALIIRRPHQRGEKTDFIHRAGATARVDVIADPKWPKDQQHDAGGEVGERRAR